jgi:hypothetical protein
VFAVRYGDPPDPPAVKLLMDVLRAVVVPPQRLGAHGSEDAAPAEAARVDVAGPAG